MKANKFIAERQALLIALIFFLFLAILAILFIKSKPTQTPLNGSQIKIGNKTITVDVASTPAQQEKGLGGIENLTDEEGMLFPFTNSNYVPGFWMRGMLIPIDIIWIKDNKVIYINKNAPPEPGVLDYQLKLYKPQGVATIDYVLETAAGFSDRYGIDIDTSVDLGELF